jgi:Peptidase inhibitor family I36
MLHIPSMPRRVPAALLLAAAAVVASLALFLPASASAGSGACSAGDFCLWQHADYDGGRYNWSGSDSTLYNDKFVGTNVTVANEGSSLRNAGVPDPYDDVRVYYYLNSSTPSMCVPRGTWIPNLVPYSTPSGGTWNDNITRYSWVRGC